MLGYLVFSVGDLKDLADMTIINAEVKISGVSFGNKPWLVPDEILVNLREGNNTYFAHTLIPSDSITDINFSSWALNNGLQDRIMHS